MKFVHLLLPVALCAALPLAASAQWQWVDKDGKQGLQRPGAAARRARKEHPAAPRPPSAPRPPPEPRRPPAEAADEPAAAAAKRGQCAKVTGVDKELEEKTQEGRSAEEEGQEGQETAKLAKAKADNCNRARQGKATFDSGIRCGARQRKGEREIMDDTARAVGTEAPAVIIDSDCKRCA
jgi:hypothetical protein